MDLWRRIHRTLAWLFLLAIPPAAFFSAGGDPVAPHPAVYGPLLPLLGMTVTGTWMLARPWFSSDTRRP
jgi:hypothetical protein